MADGLRRLQDWRTFFFVLTNAPYLPSPNSYPILVMAASPYLSLTHPLSGVFPPSSCAYNNPIHLQGTDT